MIATRFRSVYWVGGVAVAALGCYLVSQRVAAERATLARVESEIVQGERQIRMLRTEIATRAGMNQIERWNTDVLSLSAPKSAQYVASEIQLASLVQPVAPALAAAKVVQAAVVAPAAPAVRVTSVSYTPAPVAPAAKLIRTSYEPAKAAEPEKAAPAEKRDRVAKAERAEKPARTEKPDRAEKRELAAKSDRAEKPKRADRERAAERTVADDTPRVRPAIYVKPADDRQKVALLDNKLLGDLGRLAARERTQGKRGR